MTKDEIIKALRDMAKYPTVTLARDCEALRAAADLLEQQKQKSLHPVHIGVDVTQEGTTVTAFYRKPDAVMEMFYSQFHPMAQPTPVQEPSCKDCRIDKPCSAKGKDFDVCSYYVPPPQALAAPVQGQAPCATHCESTAYEIVIRGLKGDIERMKAAQRTWVGLTKEDMPDGENPMFDHEYFIAGMVFAAKILEEKNT